jgi:predicted Zn-dependent protease with MMP-like domain
MIKIDRMEEILDEIVQTLPEDLFRELNGGVLLLPEAKRSPVPGAEDLFILGEYHHDSMGRYISLYYGSFRRLFGRSSENELRTELRKTLLHELTHHMESLAGLRDLEVKDELELEEYLSELEEYEEEDNEDT